MTAVFGIFMLGVLVFIHEMGHFLVAKANGVKVLKFSLGFGPKLVSRKWGETEYLICAIPLGGYVQMLGEGGGEQGENAPLTQEEEQRSFSHKSAGKRIAIVAAGPLMNLLLPFLILPIAFMSGVNMPVFLDNPACIDYVVADSDASRAGVQVGDCITAIGGEPVETWQKGNLALVSAAGKNIRLTVERENKTVDLLIRPENNGLDGLMALGIFPVEPAIIGGLQADGPAMRAGLQVGDHIIEISGKPVRNWFDMTSLIQTGEGRAESFVIDRNGEILTVQLAPEMNETGKLLVGIVKGHDVETRSFGLIDSISKGGEQTVELIKLTVVFVQKLFSGDVSSKNIGGMISVVEFAGEAAQTGVAALLTMLAFISIQLGILNLLPIPILDGGHLLFSLIELITRRPVPMRIREPAQQIGLMLLLALMAFALYNDILRKFL
ncbi:MAG: RIP metalloprotease RseP [Desulfuromonadales bacterium]|nr:RIP metalloprotease RseP [Desulfuromonadales bacterium]